MTIKRTLARFDGDCVRHSAFKDLNTFPGLCDFGRGNGPFFKQRQSLCRSIYKKSREWAVCL